MAIAVLDGVAPRSRANDPVTSVDAGRAADLSRSQSVVLAAMRARGAGCTQAEIEGMLPGLSPSRARSAVSELAERGLVVATGETRTTKYGRQARVFEAVTQ
ncbi:MAG: MarR family transcriptional regulator [Actinobacteria bacterium]|nr:MarR family transcriptional regulator [Actinomycetota bacterium]